MADLNKLDILLPKSLEAYDANNSKPVQNVVEGDSFQNILKTALNNVDTAQHTATEAIQQALNGENHDIHDTMIAMQKADTSLKMMMEVRNKLLSAYQEVIKTQV